MAETVVKSEEKIREEVRAELQVEFDVEFDKQTKALREENEKTIRLALEEFRKEQEPPTPEQISQLLSEEYLEFKIKLPGREEDFTIRELSISVEKKFYKLVKDKLLPKITDLNLITVEGEDLIARATALFNVIDPTMDLLADAAAICLNPTGKEDGIKADWVKDNVSSYRVWNILVAQMEANRLRDFFSGVSRTSRSGKLRVASTQN